MLPEPLPALPRRGPEPGRSDLAFDTTAVALGVAGFIGAASLVWQGMGLLLHFFGESATPEELAESRRLLRLAAVIGPAVPLVGLLLALWVRRRGVVIYFVVLLVLGSLFAGLVGFDELGRWEPAPVDPGPRGCQEHSGGDNRCPGG